MYSWHTHVTPHDQEFGRNFFLGKFCLTKEHDKFKHFGLQFFFSTKAHFLSKFMKF